MKLLLYLISSSFLLSCTSADKKTHLHDVGFPTQDKTTLLDPDFTACDSTKTYYYYNQNAPSDRKAYFKGGSKAIKRYIQNQYPDLDLGDESGMFTIHFLLNCKGEIDHFQFVENDLNYVHKKFPKHVKDKLFTIHQSLEGWQPIYIDSAYRDCFMHTTYKLKNGKIEAILP